MIDIPVSAVLAETSYVSPVLLGRAGHLDRLTRFIDAAPNDPRTVLVAGEAGIGKSRLILEASSLATTRAYRVLQGTCFEHDRGASVFGRARPDSHTCPDSLRAPSSRRCSAR